jgi:hypothetical protein
MIINELQRGQKRKKRKERNQQLKNTSVVGDFLVKKDKKEPIST